MTVHWFGYFEQSRCRDNLVWQFVRPQLWVGSRNQTLYSSFSFLKHLSRLFEQFITDSACFPLPLIKAVHSCYVVWRFRRPCQKPNKGYTPLCLMLDWFILVAKTTQRARYSTVSSRQDNSFPNINIVGQKHRIRRQSVLHGLNVYKNVGECYICYITL